MNKIKKIFLSLILLIITTSPTIAEEFDHSIWNDLLQNHVFVIRHGQASRVDYDGLLFKQTELNSYLSKLSDIPMNTFSSWNKSEQLAFLINAYNAYTVQLILTRYPDLDSIKDIGFLFFGNPWKKEFIPLLGETRSLDNIEHKLIRGSRQYNEPRIHFAVNCASVGCPALRNTAYTGEKLEEQLEAATQGFLADRTRNRYNTKKTRLEVSKIFDWYREDFEQGWKGWHSLRQFFAHYAADLKDIPKVTPKIELKTKKLQIKNNIKIKFLDYDWTLNRKES